MRRGDLYRLRRPGERDPKRSRVFVVASRQTLIDSRFSRIICAPYYTSSEGLATEVAVGIAEGRKHESSILCDALISAPKSALTDFVGSLPSERLKAFDAALRIVLALEA